MDRNHLVLSLQNKEHMCEEEEYEYIIYQVAESLRRVSMVACSRHVEIPMHTTKGDRQLHIHYPCHHALTDCVKSLSMMLGLHV